MEGIAGHGFKGRIDVFEQTLGVGHHYHVGGLLHGAGKLAQRVFRSLPSLLGGMQIHRTADGAHQIGAIELRAVHTVDRARLDNLRQGLLVDVLGEHDKGDAHPGMQELGEDPHSAGVPSVMIEQYEPVAASPKHGSGFRKGSRVVEVYRQRMAVSLQDVADKKEIFLPVAHQQDVQG